MCLDILVRMICDQHSLTILVFNPENVRAHGPYLLDFTSNNELVLPWYQVTSALVQRMITRLIDCSRMHCGWYMLHGFQRLKSFFSTWLVANLPLYQLVIELQFAPFKAWHGLWSLYLHRITFWFAYAFFYYKCYLLFLHDHCSHCILSVNYTFWAS